MIRLTLTSSLTFSMLLLCGGVSRIQAQSSTKITVKDGGSLLLSADGLDAAKDWKISNGELRHLNANGLLDSVKITEGGADQCKGDAMCGVDPKQSWSIQITYDTKTVTISSVSANKGLHLKLSYKIHLDKWKNTANADEREFGHGDGHHIGSIHVNGAATSLCAGNGGCEITLTFPTS